MKGDERKYSMFSKIINMNKLFKYYYGTVCLDTQTSECAATLYHHSK